MSLVSVIIPVYNTEKFIEEAVRSIMNQTLRNIEIIIINDGSTDDSLSIINALSKEDERIQVHNQRNQGPSITRNNGLKYATGKFIYFIDSDDFLEPDALECCWNKCEQENLDFVFFDGSILNKGSKYKNLNLNYQRKGLIDSKQVYTGIQVLALQIEHNCYTPSTCLNFIRYDFLQRIKLYFLSGIIHEDQLFTLLLYLQANKVSFIEIDFFKRRLRENSIMTQEFSMKNINGYFIVTDHLITFSHLHPDTKKIIDVHLSKMLNAVVWLSYKMPFNERVKIAQICIRKYMKYISTKNILILLFKSIIKKDDNV